MHGLRHRFALDRYEEITALQEIDHRTGLPRPPGQRRLEREARSWGYQHT